MSGYEKPQDSYEYGFTPTRPNPEQSYAGLAQPSFDPQYQSTQANEPHALIPTHQMPYLGQSFGSRDTSYQAGGVPLIIARARLSPEITSRGPYTGRAGDTLRLEVRSKIDYTTRNVSFTVLFGSTAFCKASITKNPDRELNFFNYTLESTVPPINPTQTTMPLLLEITDENGQSMSMKALDNFTYLETSPFTRYNEPLGVQKKRKYAGDAPEYSQISAKRSASTPLQPKSQGAYPPVPDGNVFNFDSNAGLYALPTGYDRPVLQQRSYMPAISQRPPYQYATSPPLQSAAKGRSPSMSAYGSYSSVVHPSPSPQMAVTPIVVTRAHIERASSTSSNPPLIRTSILQPQTATSMGFRTPGFNPYSIYPSAKAKLEIRGDLQTMCEDWTPEELKVQRRLVEFHRSQEDSIITTSFKPATVDERTQGTHCVSCILWEERNECYVTSVDTIQLLEGLVGVRFTVEEKNRIRRNLEGFKPLTVSKQKEDSENFFRLIMGFPNPKPRNIEKDVKVFPWSILGNALKKIISKYSASYASTSSILTPSTSASFATAVVVADVDHHPSASSQPGRNFAASHAYEMGMTSTARPGNPATSVSYEPQRHVTQPMEAMGHWPTAYPPTSGISQYVTGHGGVHGRSSYQPYVEHTPIATTSHQLQYYGPGDTSAAHNPPPDDKYFPPPTSHS